tara:strand:+ start:1844 stop:5350 length:3507 start_codon:yes stop_codon:yes gene_type:complete
MGGISFTDNVVTRTLSSWAHTIGEALGFSGKHVEVGKGDPKAAQQPEKVDVPTTSIYDREIGNPSFKDMNTLQVNRNKAERFVDKEFSHLEPGQRRLLKQELLKAVDTSSLHRGEVLDRDDFIGLVMDEPYLQALAFSKEEAHVVEGKKVSFARSDLESLTDNQRKAEQFVEDKLPSLARDQKELLKDKLIEIVGSESYADKDLSDQDIADIILKDASLDELAFPKEEAHAVEGKKVSFERISVRDENVKKSEKFFQKKMGEIHPDTLKNPKLHGITRDRLNLIGRAFEFEVMRHSEIHREPLSDAMLEAIFERTAITMLARMRFDRPDNTSFKTRDGSTHYSGQEKGVNFVREKAAEKVAQAKLVRDENLMDSLSTFEVLIRCTDLAHKEYKTSDVYKEVEKAAYYSGEIESLFDEMVVADPKVRDSRTLSMVKNNALHKGADWAEMNPRSTYTREEIAYGINHDMYTSYLNSENDLLQDIFPDNGKRKEFEQTFKDNMKANLEVFAKEHPGELYPIEAMKGVFEMALADYLNEGHKKHDQFVARFPHLGAFVKKHENDLGYKYASENAHKGIINEKSIGYFVSLFLAPAIKAGVGDLGREERMLPKVVDAIVEADKLMEKAGFVESGKEASLLRQMNGQIKDLENKKQEILRTRFTNPHVKEVRGPILKELNDKLEGLKTHANFLSYAVYQEQAKAALVSADGVLDELKSPDAAEAAPLLRIKAQVATLEEIRDNIASNDFTAEKLDTEVRDLNVRIDLLNDHVAFMESKDFKVEAEALMVRADSVLDQAGLVKGGDEGVVMRKLDAQVKELEAERVKLADHPHAEKSVLKPVIEQIDAKVAALKGSIEAMNVMMDQIDADVKACLERGDAFFNDAVGKEAGLEGRLESNEFLLGPEHTTRIGMSFLDAVEKQAIEVGPDKVTDEWMASALERIAIEETVKAYSSGEGEISKEMDEAISEQMNIRKSVYAEKAQDVPVLSVVLASVKGVISGIAGPDQARAEVALVAADSALDQVGMIKSGQEESVVSSLNTQISALNAEKDKLLASPHAPILAPVLDAIDIKIGVLENNVAALKLAIEERDTEIGYRKDAEKALRSADRALDQTGELKSGGEDALVENLKEQIAGLTEQKKKIEGTPYATVLAPELSRIDATIDLLQKNIAATAA